MQNSLFNKSFLAKKLNEYKVEIKDNSAIFLKWHNDNQKEEALQTNFLNDIFGKVLGYEIDTGEDEFNLLTEYKTQKDGTKVDGVLGFITNGKKDIRVAIELKAKNTTNLDTVEKQAFEYRDKIDGIEWVITSNTNEIRLYSAGSGGRLKYQSWTFLELANNESKRKEFHFILAKDRLFTKIPNQSPVHALDTTEKGEEIEKRFYKHYSTLREEIWHNLLELNKEKHYGRNFYLYKAQKLIDRIIFIRFCKENGALDNDAVLEALNNKFVPGKYNRLKFLFQAMDGGNPEIGIARFNGGLFATDADLDNLQVSDDIIDKIVILYSHDFGSDLDVNILGHIFEQSISDLESLTGDNEKKRKKDGVFYTPAYITEYIVREAIGGWLADRKAELKAKEGSKDWWQQYSQKLQSIKIIDPACGSGAFLVKVFDYLQNEWREVGKHIRTDWTYKDILTHNIYGVDINPASTGITKLSLWLKTAHYREPLTTLDGNIKIGNSLIDNSDIAGYYSEFEGKVIQEVIAKDLFNASDLEKLTAEGVKKSLAFKWNEEFKEVFDKSSTNGGGFDVVVGNPPYVQLSTLSDYDFSKGNGNTYSAFVEKALKVTKDGSYLAYIIPTTWLSQVNYLKMRQVLLEGNNIKTIVKLPYNIFEAYVDTIVFVAKKCKNASENFNVLDLGIKDNPEILLQASSYKQIPHKLQNGIISLQSNNIMTKFHTTNSIRLGDISDINRGTLPPKQLYKLENEGDLKWFDGQVHRYELEYSISGFVKLKELGETKSLSFFQNTQIIARQLVNRQFRMQFTLQNTGEYFAFKKNLYGIAINNDKYLPEYILSILNSRIFSYIYVDCNPALQRDDFPSYSLAEFKDFKIPVISKKDQLPLITHAQKMLNLTKQFNELSNKFTKLLSADLGVAKITKKLEKWYNVYADEFFVEVGKQNKNLSLSQKSQWLEHFEIEKQKALALQNQITKTDAEIDRMVYALYGLNEDEIGVVEGLFV